MSLTELFLLRRSGASKHSYSHLAPLLEVLERVVEHVDGEVPWPDLARPAEPRGLGSIRDPVVELADPVLERVDGHDA